MFLGYYGLREQPFGVTPDPRFLYFGEVHREALASLVYGVEAGLGFTSLIAEPGTGKTTLLYYLLGHYRATARTAFIFDTQCTSRELLRNLLLEFEIGDGGGDSPGMLNQLKEFLAVQARARRRVLLVLDEAQNFDDSVLETVRLLSNFETAGAKLLHIILSGQPQLAEKLSQPELLNVRQRITIATRLRPFAPVDVVKYVAHRLSIAGYRGNAPFTPAALEAIAKLSGGVPREINRLCFSALSMGCALERKLIDADILREVANDFDFSSLLAAAPARKSSEMPSPILLEQVFAESLARAQQAAAATQAPNVAKAAAPITPPRAANAPAPSVAPKAATPMPSSPPMQQGQRNPMTAVVAPAAAKPAVAPVTAQTATPATNAVATAAVSRPAASPQLERPPATVPLQSWIARDEHRRKQQHRPALIAAALALLAVAAVAIQLLPPPAATPAAQPAVVQPAASEAVTSATRHPRRNERTKHVTPRTETERLPADDASPMANPPSSRPR